MALKPKGSVERIFRVNVFLKLLRGSTQTEPANLNLKLNPLNGPIGPSPEFQTQAPKPQAQNPKLPTSNSKPQIPNVKTPKPKPNTSKPNTLKLEAENPKPQAPKPHNFKPYTLESTQHPGPCAGANAKAERARAFAPCLRVRV